MANDTNLNETVVILMDDAGYIASALALLIIGVLGFFLNLFVIILMLRDKQLWTPLNIILFNLVCSDFSVSIFGNPFALLSALAHGWIFGTMMCQIYGFFMSLLGITSITTLTVLAFERYMMVSRPFQNYIISRRSATILVLGIWTYSLALTVPPLVGWGKYVNEAANISCSINWETQTLNAMSYICYLFIFGLFIPVTIIVFSYINIVVQMKQNSIKMGQVRKAEKRIAYMVLLMIILFMVAWTPYAVLALLIQFGDASSLSPGIRVIPSLLAKSSICYNPIVYVGLNAQFQQSWKRRKQNSSNMSESYNICVTKYIPQNTDSPLKIQRKLDSSVIESRGDSKRRVAHLTLPVHRDVDANKNDGEKCEVTQV
ncbi:rhodopsin-like [Coccinella septempunctata]|uniref:rhodopsin-like n=1 Tax=Coccinella septempunctata TaxID=41139 RepID=UPI001D067BDE|nr:rhodopsin-like [Coccinella septempunctata]